jgi:WD40 repeat protein
MVQERKEIIMNSSGSTPSSRRLHSRVAFVPNTGDLYGAINCADDGTSNFNNDPVASNNSKDVSKVSNRLKPGPPLLEIRKINYSTFDEQEESQPQTQSSWSPFQHETILVSRGIPGSVSSTCLDFAKSSSQTIRCATGLTSGALAVHSISNILAYSLNSNIGDGSNLDLPTSTVTHYAPRQQRPSSCVAWHPAALGANSKNGLVAIGLVGSGSPPGNTNSISKAATARGLPVGSASSLTSGSSITTAGIGGSTTMGGSTGDRDFGCLVWDIEAQSSSVSGAGTVRGKSAAVGGRGSPPPAKGKGSVPIKSPVYRFANNNGVESLSWLMDGQLLAVGCQKRALQLYDLRMSGTNAPPISVFAHTDAVSGIMPDDCCPTKTVFATFGRNVGEPVKIWDARMMDSTLGEIRVPSPVSNFRGEGNTFPQYGGGVTAMAWSDESPGELAIAIGDSIRTYQTRLPGSRALPVNVSYVDSGDTLNSIQCLAFQPRPKNTTKKQVGFYPHRLLTVSSRGEVSVVPNSHVAPLAISKRDGRIAHGLGDTVWIGATTEGPSAMEGELAFTKEDVSARMMRRARCLHDVRYSTDAMNNVMLLEEEQQQLYAQRHAQLSQERSQISAKDSSEDFQFASSNIDQLLNAWRWICRIENLTSEKGEENSDDFLPAKGLIDAGVMKLLRMSSREATHDGNSTEDKSKSDTLFCEVYDSPSRRAAMCACGWIKKYGSLRDLLDQCESSGEFERSAALAVWHGDLGECVAALQRGAEDVKTLVAEDDGDASDKNHGRTTTESYAETLSLIAMCVAGFNVTTQNDGSIRTSHIWSNACENLLRRPDVSEANISNRSNGAVYLRAILLFLQKIGDGFECIIHYDKILLADRVAFACKFLPRAELRSFLDASIRKCLQHGDLEGLVITGLDKRGIALLQSYVDRQSDVQTAALISSRIILPNEWNLERKASHEWLENYRLLLNNLQMFHSRAAFDCGRCEHIRQLKGGGIFSSLSASGRRIAAKKQDNKVSQPNFPPQLWARCNYCNASLPLSKLRRQEGIANSWLSRQNPVLQCCPQCKKPLPRCSICLLSLGCLNPYMELQRERNQFPRNAMPADKKAMVDDLSGLASIPFAEWFTWCMRCKHGGHAHHLVGWFSKHETCAVSGCDCKCQFDGIEKLRRPGLR